MNRRIIAIVILAPFSALTLYALLEVGYVGLFDHQLQSPAGWQVLVDLVGGATAELTIVPGDQVLLDLVAFHRGIRGRERRVCRSGDGRGCGGGWLCLYRGCRCGTRCGYLDFRG